MLVLENMTKDEGDLIVFKTNEGYLSQICENISATTLF